MMVRLQGLTKVYDWHFYLAWCDWHGPGIRFYLAFVMRYDDDDDFTITAMIPTCAFAMEWKRIARDNF